MKSRGLEKWIKITGLVATILGILAALYSGVDKLYEIISVDDKEIIVSDLNVSKLSGPLRLIPLQGYPVIQDDNGRTIYTGGVRVNITLSHNGKGDHGIIVTGVQLDLLKYSPTNIPEYAYTIGGSSIHGAGSVEPHIFSISLYGNNPGKAVKVVDNVSFQSRSNNIFDTEPARKIALNPKDDYPEEIHATLSAWENGLYEINFIIDYHVAGEDRRHQTEPVLIYVWDN